MLTVYRIVKTLFYEDPEIQPSADAVKSFFQHKNSADQKAISRRVEQRRSGRNI